MKDHQGTVDLVSYALDKAPYDEDDYPDDFLASLDQAGEEARCGDRLSFAEVKQRLAMR